MKVYTQWNLSIVDTRKCVLIREVSEVDLFTKYTQKLSLLERCPYFRG